MTRLFLSSGDASEFTLFLIGEAVVALFLIAIGFAPGRV